MSLRRPSRAGAARSSRAAVPRPPSAVRPRSRREPAPSPPPRAGRAGRGRPGTWSAPESWALRRAAPGLAVAAAAPSARAPSRALSPCGGPRRRAAIAGGARLEPQSRGTRSSRRPRPRGAATAGRARRGVHPHADVLRPEMPGPRADRRLGMRLDDDPRPGCAFPSSTSISRKRLGSALEARTDAAPRVWSTTKTSPGAGGSRSGTCEAYLHRSAARSGSIPSRPRRSASSKGCGRRGASKSNGARPPRRRPSATRPRPREPD